MVGVAIPKPPSWSNSDASAVPPDAAESPNSALDVSNYKLDTRHRDEVTSTEQYVPVIDMSVLELEGPSGEKMSEKMVRACETWGFFCLINHDIDASLLDRAKEVSREFFQLPEEEKLECKVIPGTVDGYNCRSVTAVGNNLTPSINHLFLYTSPAAKKNLDRWPLKPAAYRETMTEYAEQLRSLAEKVMFVLSERLGLQRATLQEKLAGPTGQPTQSIRSNYYTPTAAKDESTHEDEAREVNPHSDPGGLTLLLQNDVTGLEVRKDDQWVRVEPIANAFVVNIGDQLEMLSNGRYKSIEHRGLAHRTRERLSIAAFYSPNYEAEISPVRELISDTHPALYKSIKYKDYFSTFVKQGLKGKDHVRAVTV